MAESEIALDVVESAGWVARRAVGYSVYMQGETPDELKVMVQDAVWCHFKEDEGPPLICLKPPETLSQ